MKTIGCLFTLVAILVNTNMFAQEYKIPVENSKDGKLSLVDFMGDLPIEGYDGKEIIISTQDNDDDNAVPERAKGLKPIYGKGTDNTGIGVKVDKNGNQVSITCLMPITKRREYKVKVPFNFALKINSTCGRVDDVIVQDMKNEVEVTTCQDIKIKNVSGSLILSTISGDIDIDRYSADNDQTISVATVSGDIKIMFKEFNTKNPVSIRTVSGDLDVTLTPKAAVTVKMSSVSGTFYSDFEFTDSGKNMKQAGGNHANYPINGGGTEFDLGSVSGDVYLRKGK
jgi:lia operon protein LiaG